MKDARIVRVLRLLIVFLLAGVYFINVGLLLTLVYL